MLNDIIKYAERCISHFQEYDARWEDADNEEEYASNKQAMKDMNKRIGLRANTGLDSINRLF